jgi:hypothetical protein
VVGAEVQIATCTSVIIKYIIDSTRSYYNDVTAIILLNIVPEHGVAVWFKVLRV